MEANEPTVAAASLHGGNSELLGIGAESIPTGKMKDGFSTQEDVDGWPSLADGRGAIFADAGNCSGGPRTAEGKAASRRNALKHGLTADVLLPDILNADLVQRSYEALLEEWQPATPTQALLVRDMARHQAALERAEQIELAVLRRGARKPLNMPLNVGRGSELDDAILAAAGTSDAIEKISRYRRQHERALLRDLAALRQAKTVANSAPTASWGHVFSSEEECETYLIRRVKKGGFPCPRCHARCGKWLESRRVWQCRECRRQAGIRSGTILEGSRVGLLPWFRAIELLVNKPEVQMAELAMATNIGRKGTIRKMVRKIRQAMSSPDMSRRLAGLDAVFRVHDPVPADVSAPEKQFLQNELSSHDHDTEKTIADRIDS